MAGTKMRQKEEKCHSMNNQEKNTYVRQQLTDTLVEMLKTEKLDAVTVSRLCQKAGVARASFYRNYTDTSDVLQQACSRMIKAWGKAFEQEKDASPDTVFASLFNHYYAHRDFYITLVRAGQGEFILRTIEMVCGPKEEMDDPTAYAQAYFAYGLYGYLLEWMKRGMKEDGRELNEMIHSRP
jgi:AcrR family transcriptional regulator